MVLAPSESDNNTEGALPANKIEDILTAKLKGAAVETAALSTTLDLTEAFKVTTDRERPNKHDKRSFPSAHTAASFVSSSMACENLEWFDMNLALRTALQWGVTADSIGTAWAKVECGVHYPSDILFGAALGNLLSVFFTKAFLEADINVDVEPAPEGAELSFHIKY